MFVVKFFNEENALVGLSPFYFKTWDAANRNGRAGIDCESLKSWRYEVMSLVEGF